MKVSGGSGVSGVSWCRERGSLVSPDLRSAGVATHKVASVAPMALVSFLLFFTFYFLLFTLPQPLVFLPASRLPLPALRSAHPAVPACWWLAG